MYLEFQIHIWNSKHPIRNSTYIFGSPNMLFRIPKKYLSSKYAIRHSKYISWGIGQEASAEGSGCLAILGKKLFSLAGASVQQGTFDQEKSFF